MRQIALDTETTGLSPKDGHGVIEIACVELINRLPTGKHYHQYINPLRPVDLEAFKVHGISNAVLDDKPIFADILEEFLNFIKDAELIIHNAPFDVGFLDYEFNKIGINIGKIADHCSIIDTLVLARKMHPGQKNSLDALCKRYRIDNSKRTLHGALMDAQILSQVYLAMTGGQGSLFEHAIDQSVINVADNNISNIVDSNSGRPPVVLTPVLLATEEELVVHRSMLEHIAKKSDNKTTVWQD